MCPLCIEECAVLCEVGLSAFRGREALYPAAAQFGMSTACALKDFGLDWSHFTILPTVRGAKGVNPDPDVAIFPNADISTIVGGITIRVPVTIAALGSTEVARRNWDSLAAGAALAGTIQIVGENVVGMDPDAAFVDGKVKHSPELERRIKCYRDFWDGKHGDIGVQTNVEDERMGVDIYAASKLEVNIIERKWGQGAKAIGGEVRISRLERAVELKRRGYVVIPDPEDPVVVEAFKAGTIKTFERHSRVGMPNISRFVEGVDRLREHGVKKMLLKTGSYRPADVAFALRAAAEAKIDAVTFDGAGGGTGMSPVPMMDEMGVPTVYLEVHAINCARILKKHGKHVPDILMAGGFISEAQIFKAIALSNFGDGPLVKGVAMARAPLTAVMKSKYFVELWRSGRLPKSFAAEYGDSPERFFIVYPQLKERLGEKIFSVPWGGVGLYTYLVDRIGTGLKQLLAGVRKWKLSLISREDLAALSERARDVTGIPMVNEADRDVLEAILLD